MLFDSVHSIRRFGVHSWLAAAVALLLIQAAVSVTLPGGNTRTLCTNLFCGLLLLLAAGITALNADRSRGAIRLFWSFLAMALGVFSLNSWIWLYYTARRGHSPPDLVAAVPVMLRMVLMIAALAARPHLRVSRQRGRRTTINFLLLLFFSVFAYAMVLVNPPYPSWSTAVLLRVEVFYLGQNFLLFAILGVLILRAPRPWKSIYGHFLGASVLYLLVSVAWDIRYAGGKVIPGLMDLALIAPACWFVWMAVRGRNLAPELAESVQPDVPDTKYLSLVAILSVIAIPMVGLWELFRTDEPYRTHEIRLLIVLLAVLFLGVGVFVQEYLTNRDLSSEAGLADERFRLAARSGQMYAFEWDAATDMYTRSEEYLEVLGPDEARQITGQQLLASIHPEDRAELRDSIRRLSPQNPTGECSYRMMRRNGSLLWVGRRARAFFDSDGNVQRVVGMVADLSESNRQEALIRESEERLRVAAEVGRMYAWEWDPATDAVQRSAECAGILGVSDAAGEGIAKDYFSSIHPDDRVVLQSLVDSLTLENPVYRTQYRRFRADGQLLWLEESGRATFDGDGRMIRLIGMTADITEKKRIAEEADRTARYARLVQEVAEISNSATTMREALQRSLDAICKAMKFPVGHALLIHDDEPGLAKSSHVVYNSDPPRFAALFEMSSRMTWPSHQGAPGETLRTGNPIFTDTRETSKYPGRYPRAQVTLDAGLRTGIHLPVLVDDKVEAIIEFGSEELLVSNPAVRDTLIAASERLSRFFERRRAQIKFLQQKEELQASAERLFAVAGQLVDSQEEERRRIAREIHDDFTQRLALVSMKIGNLAGRDRTMTSSELDADLEDVRKTTAAVANDLRELSHQLHPAMLEILGLVGALRAQCEDIQRARGIETEFEAAVSDRDASPQAAMCLYRVLQESLTNVSRHSGSPSARVTLARKADLLEMRIRDTGRGIEPDAKGGKGIGLTSMEERVRLLNGKLIVNSTPGIGTEVVVMIPAASPSQQKSA